MLVERTPEPALSGIRLIPLQGEMYAIVDAERYDELSKYYWRAIKSAGNWYAVRRITIKGKTFNVRMHRQVAKTPWGLVCHHKNRNTLDNRLSNLNNMPDHLHRIIHFKT